MTDKFTAIIKEAQDIIESSVFPKIAVEQGNKKFLEADKKNNETQRLYRKSIEKLNNQIEELKKHGDSEDNVDPKVYYCNRKSGRGAYQAALKTAQDLQDKAIDTRRALDAEQDRQEGLKKEGLKGVITRDIVVKPSKKHDSYAYGKVLNKNESLEILKEAQDIMSNLFEVEYYGANDVEEEQNNKIKRQGKDKHGNKVDLVSVQDELFPYEGNAKEQYNKKIIAKINDMIEGKATLEDLIQLVRNKKTPVKESVVYESLKDIIDKKFSIAKMKLQGTKQGFQGIPNGPSRERDAATIDYSDNIKNFNHIADLGNKMIEAQRKVKEQRKQEGKPPIDSRTKGERGQDRANIISAEYAGDIKRYIADKKKKEGTNRGYNSPVNKSIRRHQNKVQEGFEDAVELLEDLIQLVRNKKTPVLESEFTAHKGNPVVKITDKNYKVAHGKGLPGPFNEKQIGQYIVYNKDTDASYLVTPDNWKKSKIKRDLEREGKVFEGAIELLEAMINEVSKVERFEAGKSSLPKREAEFSKVSNELDDLVKKHNYKYTGDMNVASPKDNSKLIPEVENKIEEFKKKADRRAHAKDIVDTEGEGHTSLFAKDTSKRSFSDHEKRIKKN